MELSESLQQLKNSLAKYAQSRIFHLSEAAEILRVAEEHLSKLAQDGKIRAFKIGEHWFMEEPWLDDFRRLVRNSLQDEIAQYKSAQPHGHGWSKPLSPRRKIRLRFSVKPLFSIPAILFSSVFGLLVKTLVLARRLINYSYEALRSSAIAIRKILSVEIPLPKIKMPAIRIRRPAFKLKFELPAIKIALPAFSLGKFFRQIDILLIRSAVRFRKSRKHLKYAVALRQRELGEAMLLLNRRLLVPAFQGAVAAAALAVLAFGLSIVILPLSKVGINRDIIALNFISAVHRAYDLPLAYAGRISSRPINDEQLTQTLYRWAGKNPPGQVAGAYESRKSIEIR